MYVPDSFQSHISLLNLTSSCFTERSRNEKVKNISFPESSSIPTTMPTFCVDKRRGSQPRPPVFCLQILSFLVLPRIVMGLCFCLLSFLRDLCLMGSGTLRMWYRWNSDKTGNGKWYVWVLRSTPSAGRLNTELLGSESKERRGSLHLPLQNDWNHNISVTLLPLSLLEASETSLLPFFPWIRK